MKRAKLLKDISKQARANGVEWTLLRQGANHELWQFGTTRVTIPRHSDINELTANGILKTIKEAK